MAPPTDPTPWTRPCDELAGKSPVQVRPRRTGLACCSDVRAQAHQPPTLSLRFDREITLGVPDQAARERILTVLTGKMRLSGDLDLALVAKKTPGFVGADLSSLTKEAAVMAINRIFRTVLPLPVAGGEVRMGGSGEVGKGGRSFRSVTVE